MMDKMPLIKLAGSGLVVGNFSSPHKFEFVTEEVLEACSADRAKALMLGCNEREVPHTKFPGVTDIVLSWELSPPVWEEAQRICEMADRGEVDICLVPLPVMEVLVGMFAAIWKTPFRVIRVANRITKQIHVDRFCLK